MDHPAQNQAPEGLSAMSYLSEAGPGLRDPGAVLCLIRAIRGMSAQVGVTGAISYHRGYIRQWIEGPPTAITDLGARILTDPRHRILSFKAPAAAPGRLFAAWPMQLALTAEDIGSLATKDRKAITTLPPLHTARGDVPMACLDALHVLRQRAILAARARTLADAVLLADPARALDKAGAILRASAPTLGDMAQLIQMTLDCLADDWTEDHVSGAQCSVAQALLQGILKRAIQSLPTDPERSTERGTLLVSALPGATDVVGIILKVAILRQEGWGVTVVLPRYVADFADAYRNVQPDAVVLSGSRLFARRTDLAALQAMVQALSTQGRSPAPPVVIGGKLAESDPASLFRIGAAAVCEGLETIAAKIDAALTKAPEASRPRRRLSGDLNLRKSQCSKAQQDIMTAVFSGLATSCDATAPRQNQRPALSVTRAAGGK